VVIEDGAAIQSKGSALGDVTLEMQVLDATESAAGGLMLLLGLRLITAREKPAGGNVDPVVVGVGAALKYLLRRELRSSGRGGIGAAISGRNGGDARP